MKNNRLTKEHQVLVVKKMRDHHKGTKKTRRDFTS